ncbi:dihydrodipicolinate synthase family protein [Haloprofundus halobius]|uniref:dihydrodipicolinate synthase family protein n=1 Tax=Haloprofundus halobius TaxID=2876194 RepID=UPI001CCBAFC3|nr:dihydrodipicolinate synthase family protein [Haloprofundus halobius]
MLRDDFREMKEHISGGIMPATAVPWTPDYELIEDDLSSLVSYLAGVDGIVGLVANAHTGECKMLSREMKQRVIRVHKEAAGDVPVFSGVYGESSLQAAEMAREAEEAGADGLMLLPLDIYSNQDPREPVEHFERVAEAVDIPLINFQFPTWGSAGLPISAHVEICSLPEVIGFKEASFDPMRYEETVRALDHIRDDFTQLTGNDTFLYHAYHLGAETGLIGYGNLVPELHVEKIRAVHDGDLERAKEIREQLLPLTNHVFGTPEGRYRARVKAALEMQGIFQYDTLLPPQQQISAEERQELREILVDLGEL